MNCVVVFIPFFFNTKFMNLYSWGDHLHKHFYVYTSTVALAYKFHRPNEAILMKIFIRIYIQRKWTYRLGFIQTFTIFYPIKQVESEGKQSPTFFFSWCDGVAF